MSTTPSIGRRVWYWPVGQDDLNVLDPLQPCDAGIVFVGGDNPRDFGVFVNLIVTDHLGYTHRRRNVHLLDPGQVSGTGVPHATWMPYQIAQKSS
jgi:hypothetical protein